MAPAQPSGLQSTDAKAVDLATLGGPTAVSPAAVSPGAGKASSSASPIASPATLGATGEAARPARLVSLDAYRGFIMLAMASAGFGLFAVSRNFPESETWRRIGYQFEHVDWVGCSFWDLIQPSFMFMVGVSMAYSYAVRSSKGDTYRRMFGHALVRSLILIALGVFLSSASSKQTNFEFMNVLTQIGLGYPFLFLLWGRRPSLQAAVAGLILVGHWALFALYPAPGPDFDYATVGVVKTVYGEPWEFLTGFERHWEKNSNVGAAVDQRLLNAFPRREPFVFNRGGYATINFIPSLATMIFGLLAGELLRSARTGGREVAILAASGVAMLAVGWGLGATGVAPIIKRLWTPSWAIFSTGWTLLMLAGFYLVIDLWRWQRWAKPLVIVGVNSIAMYVMAQLMKGWIWQTEQIHLGWTARLLENWWSPSELAAWFAIWEPAVKATAVVLVLWLICAWMYRQKIFIRI